MEEYLWESFLVGQVPWLYQHIEGRTQSDAAPPAALLSGSFDPLHAGHIRLAEFASGHLGRPVAFELSIANADKPSLQQSQAQKRARQFVDAWPLWLTHEPTFVGKARLFPGVVFVLGIDTAVRVIEPKYYGGVAGLDAALEEIAVLGCRFAVAGRLVGAAFQPADTLNVPRAFAGLFDPLPGFRVDLSSTQIRESRSDET